MRNYELTYLISAGIPEEETKNAQEKINSLIQNEGGLIIEAKLSIRKDKAYLNILSFQALPEKLSVLEEKLKQEPQILRHLITVKQEPREMPMPRFRRPVLVSKPQLQPKVELKEIERRLEEILGEN